jgi:hypothetical protein
MFNRDVSNQSVPFLSEPRVQINLDCRSLVAWSMCHWVGVLCVNVIVGEVHDDDL